MLFIVLGIYNFTYALRSLRLIGAKTFMFSSHVHFANVLDHDQVNFMREKTLVDFPTLEKLVEKVAGT